MCTFEACTSSVAPSCAKASARVHAHTHTHTHSGRDGAERTLLHILGELVIAMYVYTSTPVWATRACRSARECHHRCEYPRVPYSVQMVHVKSAHTTVLELQMHRICCKMYTSLWIRGNRPGRLHLKGLFASCGSSFV